MKTEIIKDIIEVGVMAAFAYGIYVAFVGIL